MAAISEVSIGSLSSNKAHWTAIKPAIKLAAIKLALFARFTWNFFDKSLMKGVTCVKYICYSNYSCYSCIFV